MAQSLSLPPSIATIHLGITVWLGGLELGEVGIEALGLGRECAITVRLEVEETAHHVDGLNLFGRCFRNYPQDIMLRVRHR